MRAKFKDLGFCRQLKVYPKKAIEVKCPVHNATYAVSASLLGTLKLGCGCIWTSALYGWFREVDTRDTPREQRIKEG